jgi:hypothetical protein
VKQDRVLRRIFGPEREDARGIWRKMRNEQPNVRMIRSRRCMRHAAHMKEQEMYTIFWWERLKEKRLHVSFRLRWEDNIKIILKNRIGGCGLDSLG